MKKLDFSPLTVFSISVVFLGIGFLLQNPKFFLPGEMLNAPGASIIDGMSDWLGQTYRDTGFARRAMLGTLLSPLGEFGYPIYVGLSTAAALFLLWSISQSPLGLVFAIAPFGAQNVGWMFGRFDWINLALLILALKVSNRIAVSALLCLMLLIHEASLFYAVPLVCAVRRQILIAPLALGAALALFGNSTVDALGATRGVFEFRLSYVFIGSLLFAAGILARYAKSFDRITLSALAPLAVLCLWILGYDASRWVTILAASCCITLVAMGRTEPRHTPLDLPLAMVQLGPLGVVELFPVLTDLRALMGRV